MNYIYIIYSYIFCFVGRDRSVLLNALKKLIIIQIMVLVSTPSKNPKYALKSPASFVEYIINIAYIIIVD